MDEVGRGPVAGPVTVGACVCHVDDLKTLKRKYKEVGDSKKVSVETRKQLTKRLRKEGLLRCTVASVSAQEIDRIGISKSLKRAVAKCLSNLRVDPKETMVLLDGRLYAPKRFFQQKTIIKGDSKEWLIGAASIIAKVHRDQKMEKLAEKFPNHGFERHVGYGTKEHYQKIKKYGLTKIHRKSFLKKILCG